ncbi:MAG: serine/threonine-protein kinase [Myxococcota bacterium]
MHARTSIRRTCKQCGATFRGDIGHCTRDGTILSESGRDPLLGRKLRDGRYLITHFVGEGSAGRVYAAKDFSKDCDVAIKVMFGELAIMPDLLQRFYREAEASKQLDHPHVVSVIDSGFDDPNEPLFLVMDYVNGPSLTSFVADYGPMSVDVTKKIFKCITSGLAHAHEQGVLHRDLKPDNIILSEDHSEARIVDFGVSRMTMAKAQPTLTSYGRVIGTPGFIAPEVLRGLPPDERADLYSLGVTAHFALTGRYPFVVEEATWISETLAGVEMRHLNAAVSNAAMRVWVGRLLAMDRESRPVSAEHALQALHNPRASIFTPQSSVSGVFNVTSSPPSDVRPKSRRKLWAFAAANLVAGTIGVGAALTNLQSSRGEEAANAPSSVAAPTDARADDEDAPLAPTYSIDIPVAEQPPAAAEENEAPANADKARSKRQTPRRVAKRGKESGPPTSSADAKKKKVVAKAKHSPLQRTADASPLQRTADASPLQRTADEPLLQRAADEPPLRRTATKSPLRGAAKSTPRRAAAQPLAPPTADALIKRYTALGQKLEMATGPEFEALRQRYLDLPIADALRRPDRLADIHGRVRRLEADVDRLAAKKHARK